jgi:hypothetical protein
MSIERVVAVLTPIFAALAAWLTGLIGAHFPGVHIDSNQIIALEITGFTGATAAALKWLHGRAQFVNAEKSAVAVEAKVRAEIAASPQAALAIGDVEHLLKSHTAEIETAIDQHVPAAVGQALQVLFSQLGQPAVQAAAASAPSIAVPAPGFVSPANT